jgi:D-alanyl-D-alanine carboxypeptidase
MDDSTRIAQGGVGAAVIALGLIVLALSAGWLSGAVIDGHLPSCPTGCVDIASADSDTTPLANTVLGDSATLVATPTEPPDFPFVSARSIAVVDAGCGALMFGRDEHLRLAPASLTKLMTAAVAIEQADPGRLITSKIDGAALNDENGSTVMGLQPGMELRLLDLLYGLLLPSGNDAAITIADGIAGSQEDFVALMNEKAESLALEDTHFTNPHGLSEDGLYSSAYDMAIIARFVMQNSTLREIVGTLTWQPRWDGPPVWNGNELLTAYEGADGVKIGYTEEAQQTIVASATRGGRTIVASLMRSQDRYEDSERVLDWAFDQPSACP